MTQDVVEYVASLSEVVGLVGVSFGGYLALSAAARSNLVDAVVAFEPAISSFLLTARPSGEEPFASTST